MATKKQQTKKQTVVETQKPVASEENYDTYSKMPLEQFYKGSDRPRITGGKQQMNAILKGQCDRLTKDILDAVDIIRKLESLKKKEGSNASITKTAVDSDGNEQKVTFNMRDSKTALKIYLSQFRLIALNSSKIKKTKTSIGLLEMKDNLVLFLSSKEAFPAEMMKLLSPMIKERVITRNLLSKLLYYYISYHTLNGPKSMFKMDSSFKNSFKDLIPTLQKTNPSFVDTENGKCSTNAFFSLTSLVSEKHEVEDEEKNAFVSRMQDNIDGVVRIIDEHKAHNQSKKKAALAASNKDAKPKKAPKTKTGVPTPADEPAPEPTPVPEKKHAPSPKKETSKPPKRVAGSPEPAASRKGVK
jgi:hypothetical protein